MKDKRGQGISMEFIIIAAIALIVLIVIILFFTGGLQTLFGQQKETVGTVTDQQKEIWRSQCNLFCGLGQKENFQNKEFKISGSQSYKCGDSSTITGESLKVECGDCLGTLTNCGTQKNENDCKVISGCKWVKW